MTGQNYLRAAYAYLYIGDYQSAAAAFQRAVDAEPDNPDFWFAGSITLLRNGRLRDAMAWARAAVRLDPADVLYHSHLLQVQSAWLTERAMQAVERRQSTCAVAMLQEAVRRDPCNAEAARRLEQLLASGEPAQPAAEPTVPARG